MRFEILGPIRVRAGDSDQDEVTIPAGRQRILLAILLLHANRTVPTVQLVDAIWPADPPPRARSRLQVCVFRLRRRLADAGGTPRTLVTDSVGYRVTVGPGELDLLQFRQLVTQARDTASAGRSQDAAGLYRSALALWRGRALDGIDNDSVYGAMAALDEERAEALEERIELELASGAARQLVAELTDLVRQHPHREGLHRSLMLALYRADRQADALAAYRRARQHLRNELGIEPGAELQRLHKAILNRDPSLNAPPTSTKFAPPRELPAAVTDFTGRADAIKELDGLLAVSSDGTPAPVVISAIAGTAGVGKTALAVHWAHRVADRFPDGQLYINLRGHTNAAPLRPLEALTALLHSLGTRPEDVPTEEAQAATLYRTKLADRRVLVVLDNATAVDQVRPLLPGSPGSFVLVTSRNRLAGLVARDGAYRLPLDVLTPDEAKTLLAKLLGVERLHAESTAATWLAEACARLPLALRIAAAHLTERPDQSISVYVSELTAGGPLAALRAEDDEKTTVRGALEVSYQVLPADTQRIFRFLGLVSGQDFTPAIVAALSGLSLDGAEPHLRRLETAYLIDRTSGRFAFHDLLRAYAVELVHTVDTGTVRATALGRMLDYYLHAAHTATRILYPRDPITISPAAKAMALVDVDGYEQAMSWFSAEADGLLAVVEVAATSGFEVHAWQIAWTLIPYLDYRGRWLDLSRAHTTALRAAHRAADPIGQAHSHHGLGVACTKLGQYDDALFHHQQALDLYRQLGAQIAQANTHMYLGMVLERQSRYAEALDQAQTGLSLFETTGRLGGQANALNSIGWLQAHLGDYHRALSSCRRALDLFQRVADQHGESASWDTSGYVYHQLGRYREAVSCYRRALKLRRALGARHREAVVLMHLGDTHDAAGQPALARDSWQNALDIFDDLDRPEADKLRAKLQRHDVAAH